MGCPQGGVLSPFLWNLVVDILLKMFSRENLQAFADDLCKLEISPHDASANDISIMVKKKVEGDIERIDDWCKLQGLNLSAMKTQVIFWGNPN